MPLDPEALGKESEAWERSWKSKDSLLYSLGVGAGTLDPVNQELEFTTENSKDVTQRVLPTMGVVLGSPGIGAFKMLGTYNPAMVLHGDQYVEQHREIPVEGRVRATTKVSALWDKGKAALAELESVSVDVESGDPLFTTRLGLFIRGEGGWGGESGPSGPKHPVPDRDPDETVAYATRTDQALLYRLNGDRNPLHSDPKFAARGGFDKPILHGLCTYGVTGRALLHHLCDSDPSRFRSMYGRFTSPVMPGETLSVHIWHEDGAALYRTTGDDGRTVLDDGRCVFDPR